MRKASAILIAAILAAAISAAAVAAWLYAAQPKDSVDWRDCLRIGYAIEAPYAFLEGNAPIGESPAMAKTIAERLGVAKIEWVNCEFPLLASKLESGEIDVIASGYFITPERKTRLAFSIPTFTVREGLLTAKGNPLKLKSYRQAAASGAKIAVIDGSVEQQEMIKLGVESRNLLAAPDALTARIAVESGKADALALSAPTVRWMEINDASGKIQAVEDLEQLGEAQYGAFAFRPRDKELLSAWNACLSEIAGTEEHLSIIGKYGFAARDLPPKAKKGKAP